MSGEWTRLYELFHSTRDSLFRWIYGLITVIVFTVLVLWPYVKTIKSLETTEASIQLAQSELNESQRQLDIIQQGILRAGYLNIDPIDVMQIYPDTEVWVSQLDKLIINFENKQQTLRRLRALLSDHQLAEWPSGKEPAPETQRILQNKDRALFNRAKDMGKCFWFDLNQFVSCEIYEKKEPISKALFRLTYDRTQSHMLTAELKQTLEQVQKQFNNGLVDAIEANQISEWTRKHLDLEFRSLNDWYKKLREMKRDNELIIEALENKSNALEQDRENLQKREASISQFRKLTTPIGELPVVFDDLLAILPALIIISGIAMLTALNRLLNLRIGMFVLQPRFDDVKNQKQHWGLITPIWLDPMRSGIFNLMAGLLMVMPIAIALVSYIALRTLPPASTEGYADPTLINIVGLVLCAIYLWCLINLFRSFQTHALDCKTL